MGISILKTMPIATMQVRSCSKFNSKTPQDSQGHLQIRFVPFGAAYAQLQMLQSIHVFVLFT